MNVGEILGLVTLGFGAVLILTAMIIHAPNIELHFNKKIVKFKDGTYGIRKWTIEGYKFKDLDGGGTANSFWWRRNGEYGRSCRGSLERVTAVLNAMTDNGMPIKDRYPPTNLNGKMYE